MQEFSTLGCHVAYVINASNRGDYSWHEFCVRFWLHLNYKNELDGVTWERRLFVTVWFALTALALGEDVLVHCRQGRHRSGIVVMLLMSILAVVGSEDYQLVNCMPQAVVSVQSPVGVRKGGRTSVEFVEQLMSYCSGEIMQEYDSIEGVLLGSGRVGGWWWSS